MRATLSQELVKLAQEDPRVILLTGDHGYALFDDFRRHCPLQYVNAGIAEQNMVGVAAGLAKQGFRPIVYGLSAFVPIRVLEQIKLDVAHDSLPVIFLGDGAGFVYSHLGTSHQSTEDIAALRAVPNVKIFSPGDRFELIESLRCAHLFAQTTYIRLGKADLGDVHTEKPNFEQITLLPTVIATNLDVRIAFIGTGSMSGVAKRLAKESFPGASAWSVPAISNLRVSELIELGAKADVIVTLEEHSVAGGLGGLIAEIFSEHLPKHILRVGVQNRFSELCGTYDYLLEEHGLNYGAIVKKVEDYIELVSRLGNH